MWCVIRGSNCRVVWLSCTVGRLLSCGVVISGWIVGGGLV